MTRATIACVLLLLAAPARAQLAAVDRAVIDDLVAASRILADQGVVDAFGHVSVRHPRNPGRYVMSRNLAPALVTAADLVEYDLDSNAIDPAAPAGFLERPIHGEIYRARPDVNAVVHSHSPSVVPFSVSAVPLRPVYHMAGFLAGGVPVFEIRQAAGMTDLLIRNAALGAALARTLGARPVALLRGHGNVVAGNSIQQVVYRAVYTEMNARLQQAAIALGGPVTYLEQEEGDKFDATIQGQIRRPWELWKEQALRAR